MGEDIDDDEEDDDSLSLNESVGTGSLSSLASIASLRQSLQVVADGGELPKDWEKYRQGEIDFFCDTIQVRKDAIDCYADYNNQYKSIFYDPDLEELAAERGSMEELGEEVEQLGVQDRGERVEAYLARIRDQGSLKSLRESLLETASMDASEAEPTWAKFRLEEIDFFLNTLDIRKDVIGHYDDYNEEVASVFMRRINENTDNESGMGDRESDMSESEADETDNEKITRCALCKNFICKRNFQIEKIAKIFFQVDEN